MSKAEAVAQHLPYLRSYARALTGSQTSGDAYVAATLEALVKDPTLIESSYPPRVMLYRLFSTIWNSGRCWRKPQRMNSRWSSIASLDFRAGNKFTIGCTNFLNKR